MTTTHTTVTVDGTEVPTALDVVCMQTDRNARLRGGLAARGVDALVLLAAYTRGRRRCSGHDHGAGCGGGHRRRS